MKITEDLSILFKSHAWKADGRCLICGISVDENGMPCDAAIKSKGVRHD